MGSTRSKDQRRQIGSLAVGGTHLHHQHGRGFALHETLDLATAADELGDESREDALLDAALRDLGNLLVAVGLQGARIVSERQQSWLWGATAVETHILLSRDRDSRKVDVVLLNDRRVEGVEVHDEDKLVPEAALRLKDEAALELVALAGRRRRGPVAVLGLGLEDGRLVLAGKLVGADVLEPVELVQENILVALSTSAVERPIPGSVRSVSDLARRASTEVLKTHHELPDRTVSCLVSGRI